MRRRDLLALLAAMPFRSAFAARPGPVRVIIQGQSNALLFYDGEAAWRFEAMVRQLTGLGELFGVTGMRSDFTPGAASLFSATHTYSFDPSRRMWLNPVGGSPDRPSSWRNDPPMVSFQQFCSQVERSIPADRPIVLLRMHDEYDSTITTAEERDVYEAAEREFIARWRTFMGGRDASLLPVFFAPVPFAIGNNVESYRAIRAARQRQVADSSHNAHIAVGSTLDAEDRGDGSHWTGEAANRAALRMGIRMARWLYDSGYSPGELSWLPTLGPVIRSAIRVTGEAAIDLTIAHDRGNDLVVPDRPRLSDYMVEQNGDVPATGVRRMSSAVLRLTLARPLLPGRATFDYGLYQGYSGPEAQVTDDWHRIAKPRTAPSGLLGVRMILSRTPATLIVQ